jgi:hypothetical protein
MAVSPGSWLSIVLPAAGPTGTAGIRVASAVTAAAAEQQLIGAAGVVTGRSRGQSLAGAVARDCVTLPLFQRNVGVLVRPVVTQQDDDDD